MDDIQNWIEQNIISHLARTLKKSDAEATFKLSVPDDAFFLSDLIFADVKFKDDPQEVSVVIKRLPNSSHIIPPEIFKAHFHNEILFYMEYREYCKNRVPRCYHAVFSCPEGTALVLENVRKLGYVMCPQPFDVKTEYVVASMREIAKFHSAGYVMKKQKPERFKEIVSAIREKYDRNADERFFKFVNLVAARGISHLRSINYDAEFCDKMESVLNQAFDKVILECIKPVEPLATVCHGDFLRNNVLFKKVEEDRYEAMLIDFATIRYATPAIDLATFFQLSCSKNDRVHGFHKLFTVYCDALQKCLTESGLSDLGDYSFEALLQDYKNNAIYGYVIASFFLPIMMFGTKDLPVEKFYMLSVEESAQLSLQIGGREMTKILADMLLDLRQNGCLDRFLK